MNGISMTRARPKALEALAPFKFGDDDPDEETQRATLERAKSDSAFATKECEMGFPLLHEFTLVGIWGALEAAIEDLIVAILCNEPEFLSADPFAKVRVPMADFETLDKEDRMRLLFKEVQRSLRSDQKQGVNRFESQLDAIGLSGEIRAETKENIWEMHHFRNVIVHRRSCADRSFITACPKFNLKVGERISITHQMLGHYTDCLGEYVLAVIRRLAGRYGLEIKSTE